MSSKICPAIPEPNGTDLNSMRASIMSLKQAVELLARMTVTNRMNSAVSIQELLDLGVITQDQANSLVK